MLFLGYWLAVFVAWKSFNDFDSQTFKYCAHAKGRIKVHSEIGRWTLGPLKPVNV